MLHCHMPRSSYGALCCWCCMELGCTFFDCSFYPVCQFYFWDHCSSDNKPECLVCDFTLLGFVIEVEIMCQTLNLQFHHCKIERNRANNALFALSFLMTINQDASLSFCELLPSVSSSSLFTLTGFASPSLLCYKLH